MSPTYSVCRAHGYLAGEKFICPHCGEKTEVYSRITGYYRPVQNWNDGKAEEYKNRKLYDISASMERRGFAAASTGTTPAASTPAPVVEEAPAAVEATVAPTASVESDVMLFATKTCPNCRMAEKFLTDAGISYTKIYAEDAPELVSKYGIKTAPSLILLTDGSVMKIENVSNIRRFADTAKA